MQQLDMFNLMAPPPKPLWFSDITEAEKRSFLKPSGGPVKLYVCGVEEEPRAPLRPRKKADLGLVE